MSNAIVSILVPFKNTEAFISQCIESILNQSYAYWEAIFIDDSSTDSSFNIVESYAEQDARIRPLQK